LGSYLAIIGFGLLFVPNETLMVLQSNGDYGDVFPRVAGMLMSGLGLSIFGMIRARSYELYYATLFMRVYFIVCIAAFYAMTHDPFFFGPDRHCWARASSNARLVPARSKEFKKGNVRAAYMTLDSFQNA
jgi:hypothetical protein